MAPQDRPRGGRRRGGRPNRPAIELEVIRTEQLTERMIRLVLGGPGLAIYTDKDATDRYVKIQFPNRDGEPVVRTYTVRRYDRLAGELWIDVVQHGSVGVGGPWAAAAKPGDPISLRGPGGKYRPDPSAKWHLLVGDPAAFPAIACAIEALPEDAIVHAVLGAHDNDEASYFGSLLESIEVHWVLADQGPSRTFAEILDTLVLPEGTVDGFVHGELGQVGEVRAFISDHLRVADGGLSLSGYWREGLDESGFQQAKRSRR